MRSHTKGVLAGALIAVAVATSLLVAATTGGAAGKLAPVGDGSVAALVRPTVAGDALPAAVSDMPASSWLTDLSSARLIATDPGYRAWVAPGTGGFVCLIVQVAAEGGTGINCAPRKTLESAPIYMSSLNASGGVDLVGIVDDAVNSVSAGGQSAVVTNNAFILKDMAGTKVTITGESLSRTADLGQLRPKAR